MKIITLTLNPAFDVHCVAESFELYKESVADITEKDAGGKGVNISRALCEFNIENTAYIVLGDDNGEAFAQELRKYGLTFKPFYVKGRIRENITVHTEGNPETRLSFKGFSATDSLIDEIEAEILKEADNDTYLTFTGSVPQGLTHKRIIEFLESLKNKGVKLIIDSKSINKEDILKLKPFLIKPNEEEVSAYINCTAVTPEECLKGAKTLWDKGIENVIVTLGGKGAAAVLGGSSYLAVPPKTEVVSTIGAGDSSIAGFLYALYNKNSLPECLKASVAFGTAACLTHGTNPPTPTATQNIIPKIQINNA